MKNSKWLLTTSLAAVIAFTSLSVFASAESPNQNGEMPEAKQEMLENKEAVKAAIQAGDYNAFAEVAPEQMLEQINSGNFSRFVEMHNHLEQAGIIADELGLKKKRGKMMEHREEIRAAVEAGDYQAWADLHKENSPILEVISADNFDLLQKLNAAIQAEDFETAKEIKEELGLPGRPEGKKGHKGPRFQNQ